MPSPQSSGRARGAHVAAWSGRADLVAVARDARPGRSRRPRTARPRCTRRPSRTRRPCTRVVQRRLAHAGELVARLDRARDTVVGADDGVAGPAAHRLVAHLGAVAHHLVVAHAVVRGVHTQVGGLVAGVDRAEHHVRAGEIRVVLAAQHRVAGLDAVAEQAVVAGPVRSHERAPVRGLVAAVVGARNPVVADDRRAGLAVECRVAVLGTVAVHAVVAVGVERDRDALRGVLVARVDGAGHAVVADDRVAGDTDIVFAELDAVARQEVVALGVVRALHRTGRVGSGVRRSAVGVAARRVGPAVGSAAGVRARARAHRRAAALGARRHGRARPGQRAIPRAVGATGQVGLGDVAAAGGGRQDQDRDRSPR